jgi:excisionase family DNA binding protein
MNPGPYPFFDLEVAMEKYAETILSSLLKATEVAEILNISRSMAYRLMQTRAIPTVCIGNAKRVRPVDLHNYITVNLTPVSV